ncbi:unnamed protein product, partial [Iphiclides podalirius]
MTFGCLIYRKDIGLDHWQQERILYQKHTHQCDCWVLTMKGPTWTWKEIAVRNKEWAAANIWCNPACRVGDKVVSLSRSRHGWNGAKPLVTSAVRLSALSRPENAPVSVRIEQSLQRPLDRDQNINGRRGVLPRQPITRQASSNLNNEPIAGPSNMQEREKSVVVSKENPGQDFNLEAGANSDLQQSNNAVDFNKKDLSTRKNKIKNKGMKIVRQLQEANKYRMAAFACDSSVNNTSNENDLINQRQIAHLENRIEPQPLAADNQNRQPAVKKEMENL